MNRFLYLQSHFIHFVSFAKLNKNFDKIKASFMHYYWLYYKMYKTGFQIALNLEEVITNELLHNLFITVITTIKKVFRKHYDTGLH